MYATASLELLAWPQRFLFFRLSFVRRKKSTPAPRKIRREERKRGGRVMSEMCEMDGELVCRCRVLEESASFESNISMYIDI